MSLIDSTFLTQNQANDLPLSWTTYGGLTNPNGTRVDATWGDYVAERKRAGHLEVASKEAPPLYGLHTLKLGATRSNAGAALITGLTLDLDKGSLDQVMGVLDALTGDEIACLAYTTYSNSEKQPKWRIDVPLDAPVAAEAWRPIWLGLVRKYAPFADQSTKDLARQFYVPSCPPGVETILESFPGRPLSTKDVAVPLASLPQPRERLSRDRAKKLAKKWTKSTNMHLNGLGERLERLLDGQPYAEPGERDSVTWELACRLTQELPNVDAEGFATLALDALGRMGPDAPTFPEVVSKIERARAGKPKTDVDDGIVAPRIVMSMGFGYFREPGKETYGRAVHPKDLKLRMRDALGTSLVSEEGVNAVLARHAAVADRVVTSYLERETAFDMATGLLTFAPLRWAPIRPTFHPDVDRWLRAMFGDDYPAAEQWVASMPHLDGPTPALFLVAEKGVGKTLLFQGLAHIWSCGPTSGGQSVTRFNDGLARNPLIFADEVFPSDMSIGYFRDMITRRVQKIEAKFEPIYDCTGYVRFAVAANNRKIWRFAKAGVMHPEDAEAIADRLLFIDATAHTEAAKVALPKTREERNAWGERKIAEHALYLSQSVRLTEESERMLATPNGSKYIWGDFLSDRHATILDFIEQSLQSDTDHKWENGDLLVALDLTFQEARAHAHAIRDAFELIGAVKTRDAGRKWYRLNSETRTRLKQVGINVPSRP